MQRDAVRLFRAHSGVILLNTVRDHPARRVAQHAALTEALRGRQAVINLDLARVDFSRGGF